VEVCETEDVAGRLEVFSELAAVVGLEFLNRERADLNEFGEEVGGRSGGVARIGAGEGELPFALCDFCDVSCGIRSGTILPAHRERNFSQLQPRHIAFCDTLFLRRSFLYRFIYSLGIRHSTVYSLIFIAFPSTRASAIFLLAEVKMR